MREMFDQLLQLLQQGIAAIFHFVEVIWTWSADQIMRVVQAPWDSWPIWKQILVIVLIAGVAALVYRAAIQLWVAGIGVLRAFASLLVAFIMTLPATLLAGALALGGLWVINNFSFSQWPALTWIFPDGSRVTAPAPDPSKGQPRQPVDETVGRGGGPNEPVRDAD
jgi:hypothetical protein